MAEVAKWLLGPIMKLPEMVPMPHGAIEPADDMILASVKQTAQPNPPGASPPLRQSSFDVKSS